MVILGNFSHSSVFILDILDYHLQKNERIETVIGLQKLIDGALIVNPEEMKDLEKPEFIIRKGSGRNKDIFP